MSKKYSASLSQSKGRHSWCVIFQHPLIQSKNGKTGARIRKGLGTSDKDEAQKLVDQLNEILSNESLWSTAAKESIEHKYDKRIISAFYDKLTPVLHNSRSLRDELMPLPGIDDDYVRLLLLGTTGAGKTTVVRQLIGTDPLKERFPSTSASKTTICDTEIILSEDSFKAIVTFFPEAKVRQYIEDCVTEAVIAHVEDKSEDNVAKKLLEHVDQRFRLSFILGSYDYLTKLSENDELSDEDEDQDESKTDEPSDLNYDDLLLRLKGYISRIQNLGNTSVESLRVELDISIDEAKKDWNVFQELLEYQLYDLEEYHKLVDDILDDVKSRFSEIDEGELKCGRDGWPSYWSYQNQERNTFISNVNKFSSNYAPHFGKLLTPLVDGVRVSGPFKPQWINSDEIPNLVLIDVEGLGHTSESTSSISTSITNRYKDTDVILLVDNAAQPMQAAPSAVLRNLVSSGHESKLVLCFTHFDEVKGDNLPNTSAKKNHVLYSMDGAIKGIGKLLGKAAENALKKYTLDRSFFLSKIHETLKPTARLTHAEILNMVECIKQVAKPTEIAEAIPLYDFANIVLSVQAALNDFHHPWRARLGFEVNHEIKKEHWARIKALSKRLGVLGDDEYDNLRPVADLIARLIEHISLFLSEPLKWETDSVSDDEKEAAIDKIERDVFTHLHKLAADLLFISRTKDWNHAYSEHRGPGSTYGRAVDIKNIYDTSAPIPGEIPSADSNKLISELRKLVKSSIVYSGGKIISG